MVGKSFIAALVCAVALVGAAPLDRSAELVPVPVRPMNLAASAVAHRIVAVGDIHSDIKAAVNVLKMAGLIDSKENWIGGTDTFISTASSRKKTGDLVDRGADTIAVYKLFQKLRPQAAAAGGEIVNLLGNHEVMNMGGDLRYVTKEDTASFGGASKRKAAWNVKSGWIGQFVSQNFKITHIQNGHTVFSHGDQHVDWAKLGVDTLNQMSRDNIMAGKFKEPIFRTPGPLWNRALAENDGGDKKTCADIETIKKYYGVKRLVSGHTAQDDTGRILSRCNGSYLVIDTGNSAYYGSHYSALEILEMADGTQNAYAIYTSGKVPI
ncbi:hypothetical protein BGZ93_000411 [Podila epicladia]|nr:hypothetical protein BGZ93_000411 [Podila epicladia]